MVLIWKFNEKPGLSWHKVPVWELASGIIPYFFVLNSFSQKVFDFFIWFNKKLYIFLWNLMYFFYVILINVDIVWEETKFNVISYFNVSLYLIYSIETDRTYHDWFVWYVELFDQRWPRYNEIHMQAVLSTDRFDLEIFFSYLNFKIWITSILNMFKFFKIKKKLKNLIVLNYYIFKKKILIIIYLLIFFFLFFFFLKYLKINFLKHTLKYLYLLSMIYSLITTFVFLSNSIKNGKYTSFNQRFWKISFIAFWLIEFFLFFLFTYLTLIAPNESIISLDELKNFFVFRGSIFFFYISMLCIVFVFQSNVILMNKKHSLRKKFIHFLMFLSFFVLVILIYLEFLKFFYIVNHFKYKKISIDWFFNDLRKKRYSRIKKMKLSKLIFFSKKNSYVFKNRTQNFFIYLLVILKFWHVMFVFLLYLFLINKYKNDGILSYDLLSVNYQNVIYLLFFNFYFFLIFFKKYLYNFIRIYYNMYYYNVNMHLYVFIKELFFILNF